MELIYQWAARMRKTLSLHYYNEGNTLDLLLSALCCGGHILIEDNPGTGKTLLARTLAETIGGTFSQISCTPDLLPSDIIGVSIYDEDKEAFSFRKGPLLSHVVLVDEINRATPRTQSALLEAIAEGQLSVEGRTLKLPYPFFLLATESSVDTEGTFPLPEAQKDRFFMTISPGYPAREAERMIMRQKVTSGNTNSNAETITFEELDKVRKSVGGIHVAPALRHYILDLVEQTRNDRRLVYGVSPRGTLALYKGAQALAAIRGRDYVSPDEIQELVYPVFRKRILIRPEYQAQGFSEKGILEDLSSSIAVPLERETANQTGIKP